MTVKLIKLRKGIIVFVYVLTRFITQSLLWHEREDTERGRQGVSIKINILKTSLCCCECEKNRGDLCHILIVIQVRVGPWGNLIIGLFFFLHFLRSFLHHFYYFISFHFQYLINKYELDVWQAIYYILTRKCVPYTKVLWLFIFRSKMIIIIFHKRNIIVLVILIHTHIYDVFFSSVILLPSQLYSLNGVYELSKLSAI